MVSPSLKRFLLWCAAGVVLVLLSVWIEGHKRRLIVRDVSDEVMRRLDGGAP